MGLTVLTIRVYLKGLAGTELEMLVTINEADFDSTLHRLESEGPWPASGSELKGRLPDDFPGKQELADFDPPIHTYAQLRRAIKSDVKIPGIGDKTKQQILDRLGVSLSEADDEGEE